MSESSEEQRKELFETIVDDDLDGVVVEDDDTVLAKWDREDKTVKVVDKEYRYRILPDRESVDNFENVADLVRSLHPELRPEDLEERYEDNPLVVVEGSYPEVVGNLINFRESTGDIKLRSDSDYGNEVVEVYKRSDYSIRLDVDNGYVQYIQIYDHDIVPFEAVADELRCKGMSVDRNRTNYKIEGEEA